MDDANKMARAGRTESGRGGTIALRCAGCGANLEIDSDVETLTCGYCRTPQEVVRRGGIVALKKLGDAISKVQRGTDRTAAELAIPRLEREILQVEALRTQKLAAPIQVPLRKRYANAVIATAAASGVAFFVMLSMVTNGATEGFFLKLAWAVWLFGMIGGALGFVVLRGLRRGDRAKKKAERDRDINADAAEDNARLQADLAAARAVVSGR